MESATRQSKLPVQGAISRLYISSTSIFFVAGSSLVIRNFRICPDWIGCDFEGSATAPLFQRAASIELSDDTSVAAAAELAPSSFFGCGSLHPARIPSP